MENNSQTASNPDEKTYVWVVDDYVGASQPHVRRYTLFKNSLNESKTGFVTVLLRGSKKVIRQTSGRSFHFTDQELSDRLKSWWKRVLQRSESMLIRSQQVIALLDAGNYPNYMVILESDSPYPGSMVGAQPEKLKLTEDDDG